MFRIFDLIIERPKLSLAAVFVVAAMIGSGATRLHIDFSPEQVYVGQDAAVEFCEAHKRQFRFEDSILLVLLESTDGESLVREDCLTWMQRFGLKAQAVDGVREVTSIVTLRRPRVSLRGENRIAWSRMFPESLFSDHDLLQQRLQQIPLLNDLLVSEDQQLVMTLIDLDPAQRSIAAATKRVSAVEDILADMELPPGTRTFISGVPAIRVDVIRSILNDQALMVPICSMLFLVVSMVMFRSISVTVLALFGVLTAVTLTLGLMGWPGLTFSVMSDMIPALILIIGAANNVHVLSRFQVEIRQTGCDIPTCARTTMREMSRTCFLTLATTGISFGSLLIAHAELLQSLGIQAAMGMACCYVSLMVTLPATLSLCGHHLYTGAPQAPQSGTALEFDGAGPGNGAGQTGSSRLDHTWQVLGGGISRYAVVIVLLHFLLAGWTLWNCRKLPINSYMFETYDRHHPTMGAVRTMDERMSGLISLEIQLQADHPDRFFARDTAAALMRISRQVRADDRVTFYRDYIEFLSVFDHGRSASDDADAAAASLRRVRLVLRQLKDPSLTSAFLGQHKPVARIMMRIRDVGSAGMKDLFQDVERVLRRELPADVKFQLTGDAYLHAVCMDVFVRDLFYSLIAASGVIFLLITVLFRSLRIGLISSVPNMFPLVMTLGYMHVRGYELTAGNVIVFAISLGIAVDDTIHFLARYRDERQTVTTLQAIQTTLSTSGRAIVDSVV